MKKLLSISAFCFLLSALPARAAAPTPFIAWTTDLVGENRTNAITIEAWTQTNTITGVSTNLVLNFSKTYYPTNPAGFFTGVLQPGNYRLTVEGLSRGIVFGMPSSSSTQNLAQLAGVPVYAFMNFTLAQFADAGTMAREATNTFLRVSDAGTMAYRSTNDFTTLAASTNSVIGRIRDYSNAFNGSFTGDGLGLTNLQALAFLNATSAIPESWTIASNLVGRTNDQSVSGNKIFSGSNYFSGALLVSNETGIFHIGILYATNLNGNIGALTGGVYWNAALSNALSLNGNFGNVSNGVWYAGLSVGQTLSNSTFVGTFSIGSVLGSILFDGSGVITDNDDNDPYIDFAGNGVTATYGYFADGHYTGTLNAGTLNASGGSLRTTGTNSFSDLALRRYAITSLVNGDNADVPVGTNTFVQVSGPSGAFTVHGLDGLPNRNGHLVILLNKTGQNMTLAHNSGIEPTAANRIITMTGADRATTGNGAAIFIYSASETAWQLISFDP